MEHRCGTRRTIDAEVIIDCRPAGLLHGRLRDISVGGLYVKTKPLAGMMNDRVQIVFVRHDDRGVCRIHRLPGAVVRWTREGAGLMFSELTSNAFYALLAVLLAEEQRRAVSVKGRVSGNKPKKPLASWLSKHDR
jgi:hypothetical protein